MPVNKINKKLSLNSVFIYWLIVVVLIRIRWNITSSFTKHWVHYINLI